MRTAQSLVRPICSPYSPSVPTKRITSGFFDFIASSMFLELMPSSSALIMANSVHFTSSSQSSSFCRTTGASGSLEITSARMTWSAGLAELQAQRIELRHVGGQRVALAGFVGLEHVVDGAELLRLVLHVVGAEIVGEVELGGGLGLDADLAAVERQRRFDLARARHHEALAVVVRHAGEVQVVLGLARHRPGRVARQHVDLALAELLEPLLGVERDELHLLRIVEDRSRDGAAEIDVEARPVALVVLGGEARQPGVDAAIHGVAPHRALQRLGVIALVGDGRRRDRDAR